MRFHSTAIVLLVLMASPGFGEEPTMALPPAEAAKKVNEQVTVEMTVQSGKLTDTACFLNSEKDFKGPNNFTVFIDKTALDKFKAAKILDPAAHYKGTKIHATGKVGVFRERTELHISGPDDIKVVVSDDQTERR